jgi:hypothetical protein
MAESPSPYRDRADRAAMPTSLRIGHARYAVKVDNDRCADGGLFGESHSARLEIRMDVSYPHTVVADTLLHEVMHQCLAVAGASRLDEHLKEGENVEERLILAMSGPLLGALRDNPQLVAFLLADEAA